MQIEKCKVQIEDLKTGTQKLGGWICRGAGPSRFRGLGFHFALCTFQFAFLAAFGQERDLRFNSEQQQVESARYYLQIEADGAAARSRLLALLEESRNEEILTQARFLYGKLLDETGNRDSALIIYKIALGGKGLQAPEKLWLYRRMVGLSPVSIEPMIVDAAAPGGPSRVYPRRNGKRMEYALEFRGPPDGQWERPRELGWQDEAGDFHAAAFRLGPGQEILDADPSHALVLDVEAHRAALVPLMGGRSLEVPAPGRTETGKILSGEGGEFVMIGGGYLRHYRQGKAVWEAATGEGCGWVQLAGAPDGGIGIMPCAENVVKADLGRKTLKPIPGTTDKPLAAAVEKDYLALKYIDRFEIRKGPGFETVKWGASSPLQEKLTLGEGHAYLVTPKGVVKSFQLGNGSLEWQKDMLASQVVAFDDEIFVTTFAQTCASLDLRGKSLWTYEYGWDREPALLPSAQWLVLHYPDGKRVKLNRELLRVTGNSNNFKFLDYHALETARDWKGALNSLTRILSLEPGNGQAWRFRNNVLRNLGFPRADQVQSLTQAARSLGTPNWGSDPALKGLAAGMGAKWIWKRQYGPKFYPTLVPNGNVSYYLENDNQTLVLINHETGELANSFHFSEELDMKVSLWKNDTICVSSPSRIYLLSPALHPGGLGQFPLKNPVCQAQAVGSGIVYSDWYGGLSLLGLPDRTLRWELKLGQSGLLVAKARNVDYLDVFDLEGNYFAVQESSGKVLWSLRLPPGTITESFSNKDNVYAGYNQGTLICIDRARRAVRWEREFGEQIFSLSGNKDNTLVLTTASKKLVCVQSTTGQVLSQIRIQSYLFNRPTVTEHGYWLGTTEPALEKRNFNHELILKYKLPDLPGSPILFQNSIFIGTLDNFILSFPS